MANCLTCGVVISLLTSQKNGNLETCLKCAIEGAWFVHFTLKRKGQPIDDEIVCRRHYAHESQDGRSMARLSDAEYGAGYRQTVVPYVGDLPCATCEADRLEAEDGEDRYMDPVNRLGAKW